MFLPRDYDRVSPARRAGREAGRALDEELDRLNARRTPAEDQWGKIVQAATRLMKPAEPPLRRPPAGWVIELYPDEDEELLPGHIRITSELRQPPAQAILAGDPTHRVQPLGSSVAPPPAPPRPEPVAPLRAEPAQPVAQPAAQPGTRGGSRKFPSVASHRRRRTPPGTGDHRHQFADGACVDHRRVGRG